MNKGFYLRVSVAILLATLTVLFFTPSRNHVAASSSPLSAVVSFQTGCSTPSFAAAPTSPEAAGNNPHFIATGDVNGDAHLDIVSSDFDSASVTILLGNGTGNFTIFGSPIPVGLEPVTVELADYNNDNNLDFAVCNQNSNSVSIFLGNGNGTFNQAAGSPISVGSAPRAVVKGFFNADSNLDLVTTNGGSNNLTIMLGNGDGTFTTSTLPGGFAPFHAVVADFNSDSLFDLAVANFGGGTVSIFLGNGSGGFTQFGSEIPVGTFTSYIAVGLYNADGNFDLAVTNRISNNVVILLGNGNGSFNPAAGSPYPVGTSPMAVATGDLNLDGVPDLAVSNEESANTTILLGNGLGGFGSPTVVNKGLFPTHVALADFNEDGKLDIATSDGGDDTITILLNSCIVCSAITVNPTTIATGTVNASYSESFSASGGTAPHSFSLTGTLPTGLSFIAPTLSGTPTQPGNFPITVTTMDANSCTGSSNYTLTVNCQSITVSPTTIATGTVNAFYNQSFTQSGGFGITTFSLTGTLPSGLSFSGSTLSGTPTQPGSFPITVTATDSNGCTGTRNYTLLVNCQNITVSPTTIPAGTVNSAYSQTFTQAGGIGTTSLNLTGTLPTGLLFSAATLSGTPTQSGSFPITVTATDSNGCTGTRNYTLVINCQSITVNPTTIPNGTVNTAYSQTFTHTGGVGTVTFGLSGTLPTGLTFSGATLSGTPTQTGSFPVTVTATDSNGCTGSRNYTLVIACTNLTVNPASIVEGTAGSAYSQNFTQTGGNGSVTFSLTGTLPAGLSFAGSALSGTPTQIGSFPIMVTATDANGCTGTRNYTLVINCQSIAVNPVSIAAGTAGTAYSQSFTQTGGIGTTTFALTGTLPTGLSVAGATLSGIPTQTGSFPIMVTATDANGCTGTRNYTLVINCQSISVNPATIPAGTISTAYSQTFTHTGGIGTTTFALTGTLPTGLSFAGATLSGTPTQTGSFPITVTATDANGCTGTRNYTLVINCSGITVNPATIPSGTVNTVYSQTFTQSGGVGTTTFALTGALPTGLSFAGATLSGTPTQTGSFTVTVTATDSNGCTGSQSYTLTINCQTISILPVTIPAGTAGTAYSQSFTANNAIGSVSFVQNGKLPAGLTFSGATLSGTPMQTGSYPISITATDANNCSTTRNYTLTINCQTMTITPTTIPAGSVNTAYSQSFTANNAIGPVTFTQSGKLPVGMSFSDPTLSGTPTQTGNFPITITATDSNGCSVTRNLTLTINCQTITVTPTTIATGTVNTAYNQSFTQTGGVGIVNFSLSGALPSGLSFSGGTLSGTPTQSGTFPITVTATDSNGCSGSRNYSLLINCQGFSVNPTTLPAGAMNVAYNQIFSQTGGTGAVSFNLTGTLPTGLSFAGVTLSGTPTQPGSFPITVTATDSNGCMASRNYTLVINCQTITINPTTIPAGTAGTAYSQGFTQTGGIGTTTLSLTGTLPGGLSFAGGVLSGTPAQAGTFPITITATDSNGCTGSRNYSLVINCQTITVNPTTIPAGTAGTSYSQSFTQTGGIGTTTLSLTGTLPAGLSFSGGTLSGTPAQTGKFPIIVTATDANGCIGSRNYSLTINCPIITVNPATLPNGFVGTAYNSSLSATGGIGSYTFTVSAGALPAGLTIKGSTLSGTPTTAGTFNFTLQAADSNGCTGSQAYTVIISGNGLQFYSLPTPVRLLDTRAGQPACSAPGAQIPGNTSRTQSAAGFCSIPANAKAIVGNITTVQSGGGFLTLYPSDATRPTVANSNYSANEVLNNVFTVKLGATDGAFNIYVTTNTDVVVDVTGYYAPPGAGGLYYHKLPSPIRLLETRPGQPGCFATGTPLPGGVETVQQGTTTCGGVTIPNSALVLYGNATTVSPVAGGFLTLFSADIARPGVASGNYTTNQILNSPFYVGLSASGQFKIFTTQQTHLVVDIHGYYSAEAVDVNGAGLLFTSLPTPARLLDTRAGFSGCFAPGTPLQAGIEQSQLARGTCTIGASAQAIVGNATVVNDPALGFLTLWPSDATRPTVASSNWTANKVFNRFFTVGLGTDGKFKLYASSATDLVVDVSGYFAP